MTTAMTTKGDPVDAPPRRLPTLRDLLQRGFPSPTPRWVTVLGTVAVVAGAALVAATAAIHLHLWLAGYRHVPRLGRLFMAQAVTGFVLAPVVAFGRQVLTVVGAAFFMAASAGGLVLSATVGFVGIHDGLGVPWATTSLIVELAGMVLLGGAGAVAVFAQISRR